MQNAAKRTPHRCRTQQERHQSNAKRDQDPPTNIARESIGAEASYEEAARAQGRLPRRPIPSRPGRPPEEATRGGRSRGPISHPGPKDVVVVTTGARPSAVRSAPEPPGRSSPRRAALLRRPGRPPPAEASSASVPHRPCGNLDERPCCNTSGDGPCGTSC